MSRGCSHLAAPSQAGSAEPAWQHAACPPGDAADGVDVASRLRRCDEERPRQQQLREGDQLPVGRDALPQGAADRGEQRADAPLQLP
jgi:hypothetical protein